MEHPKQAALTEDEVTLIEEAGFVYQGNHLWARDWNGYLLELRGLSGYFWGDAPITSWQLQATKDGTPLEAFKHTSLSQLWVDFVLHH